MSSKEGVTAKPRIRLNQGWYRVSKIPVRWVKLSEESKGWYRKAHAFVTRKNNERHRTGLTQPRCWPEP